MALFAADADELGKGPVGGWSGDGPSQQDGLPAQVSTACLAMIAKSAGSGLVHRYPLAHRRGTYIVCHYSHIRRQFMT